MTVAKLGDAAKTRSKDMRPMDSALQSVPEPGIVQNYPRFTKPFYYGRAPKGMVFILMFNKMYSAEDEIRFSLFNFKVRS